MSDKRISIAYLYNNYYKKSIVLKRFANVFSLDILVRASNLFLLPVYLKLMTQDEFGLYGYILAIIGIFSQVLNFGLYLAQVKLYHDFTGEERRSLIFSINVILISFLILFIVPIYFFKLDRFIITILFSHEINYLGYRNLVFLAIIVSVYVLMIQNYLMTSEKIKKYQLYNFLKLIFVNSIVISALWARNSDSVMIRLKYGYITESVLLLGFGVYYIKQMNTRFNFKFAKKAIKISIPAMLSALLAMVFNFSDKFILEKYGNFKDLAIYNLGILLATIIMLVFSSFQTVFLPFFFKEKDVTKNFNKTKAILIRMFGIFILLGIFIIAGARLAFVFHIFQPKYFTVLMILPILLLTQISQTMVLLLSNYIVYFEIVYVGTIIVFILSPLNIYLNLYFIPRYNIYGASFSALLISLISFVIYYYFIKWKCTSKAITDTIK
jgi:O-antigen/teichoic acid export membrane protein